MGREQDWKEIEKTQLNYEQGLKDQYKGIDIIKISIENRKTILKIKKINAKADKLVRALLIWYVIFLILLIIFGTHIYIMYLNNIQNRVNIDFIADFNQTVISVNSSNVFPDDSFDFFSAQNEKQDIHFQFIKIKDYEYDDLAQLAMQYSYNYVITALSTVYNNYILHEREITNLGGLLRTIIISMINNSTGPGSSSSTGSDNFSAA